MAYAALYYRTCVIKQMVKKTKIDAYVCILFMFIHEFFAVVVVKIEIYRLSAKMLEVR